MDRDTSALTGIRGIAALWVVAHHLLFDVGSVPLRHFIAKGYLAVDLFFILSGFVIALNHGAAFAAGLRLDLCLAFYRRRVERVYPLLLFVILLVLAVDGVSGDPLPSPGTLLANLTMTQAWFSLDSLIRPAWSLSVEAFAYLVFPAIAACACRRSPAALACAIVAAWCGLWYLAASDVAHVYEASPSGPLDIYFGPFPALRCLCGFVAGVCAYRLTLLPRIRALLASRGLAEALLAAVLVLTWATELDLLVVALLVPLVGALSVPTHAAARWLRSDLAMRLGELSYAIYLVHRFVGVCVTRALAGRAPVESIHVIGFAASLAAAVALHELVEKPFRSFLRSRRSPAVGAAVAA